MQHFQETILDIFKVAQGQRVVTLFGLALLFSTPLLARNIFTRYEKARTFQVLAGGYFQTNTRVNNLEKYYDSDPVKAFFPYARIKWDRFSLTPDAARFVVFNGLLAKFDFRLSYKGHSYKSTGMAIRHSTIYGGIGLRILLFKFEALKDLSGLSSASIFSVAAIIPIPLGKYGIITLQAEIEYWDGKYVDYYFGVRTDETTATRPYYKGKWAKDYYFKVMGQFFLSQHWIMRLTPGFRYYDDTITNSPTVSKQREYSLLAGIGYQF